MHEEENAPPTKFRSNRKITISTSQSGERDNTGQRHLALRGMKTTKGEWKMQSRENEDEIE